ncbi:MAG: metallophosphoesterase family protein [Acidobacteriota bacterium]
MRIALLSDIHGNLAALEAVAADLKKRGVDQIVNLGDLVSGPLLPLETAQYLMAEGWLTIAGNHERQLLTLGPGERGASDEYAMSCLTRDALAWFRTFPPTARLDSEVLLCHGTPESDNEYFLETVEGRGARLANLREIETRLGPEAYPVVACGHTHVPRSVRNARGQLIVNPGSVGLPAFFHDHPTMHAVQNGSPDARYAILERGTSGWTVELLTVPYDHRSMAALAKERDRPDWELALLTGYVE